MIREGVVTAHDLLARAQELIDGIAAEPWGQVSPSVYETGRMITLAPWLGAHHERILYLLANQRPDGGWGGPGGYALAPTLSATEALLGSLLREDHGLDRARMMAAVDRGLEWLVRSRHDDLPDMPALELIVPALTESITRHLDGLPGSALEGAGWGEVRLELPSGMRGDALPVIRSRVASGGRIPEKLLHALEVAEEAAYAAPGVDVKGPGTIGASPAATAAWLGERGRLNPLSPARRHLEEVVRRHAGPVPCGIPITVFEQAWVVSWLARGDLPVSVPPAIVASLELSLAPGGVAAGPGLPKDADTTSVALYALSLLGRPHEPKSLWEYDTGSHFSTWPGEEGVSLTVNAHVLDAFGSYRRSVEDADPRYGQAMDRLSRWLCERQRLDGSWFDRWHASPYYATTCCCLALHEFGSGPAAAAVARASRWVRRTQRADGSWGLWTGTMEETAYAMHILLLMDDVDEEALTRGHAYLSREVDIVDDPPMWHDKDLYLPEAIVRGVVLSATRLVERTVVGTVRHSKI
ncbi:hypothetical protein Aple_041480 [Acrocarpospora pleiomorpha]|uniref:Squalene cyclase C-terminal domain-containing protein n=1 Tax=Acrocarpospora pleiomorpha TaxID=90975 RepID=A0A5M3XK65_9ACTN|nr:prenyltransferase/squalene oxidase repeat-containing protein [Acrocarpospora pleiomorpha]GES21252.1 hypothetical protein Aple_041480 [Acrocarpospora pleiomorpha]